MKIIIYYYCAGLFDSGKKNLFRGMAFLLTYVQKTAEEIRREKCLLKDSSSLELSTDDSPSEGTQWSSLLYYVISTPLTFVLKGPSRLNTVAIVSSVQYLLRYCVEQLGIILIT